MPFSSRFSDDVTINNSSQAPRHRSGTVTLIGRTNVGKSTLINRLLGQKISIVSEAAQTTRHRILGVLTLPHTQIAIVDTPGIHKPRHRMNRVMVAKAAEAVRGVDLALFLVDASDEIGGGDRYIARLLQPGKESPPVILVLNKADKIAKPDLLPLIEQASREWGFAEIVPISALAGDNCDRLLEVIAAHLPEGPQLYPDDTLTDQPERRLVAEIVREKLLGRTRQELPHETAVAIESWNRREDGLIEISAVIYCDRESQKAIVIGRRGSLLKQVGTEARLEVEELLGARVMLRLWVKVREGWRDDAAILRELGIED